MNRLKQDFLHFFRNKFYTVAMLITAICSYGFAIVHPSIGVDDTAVALYLEEGLEVAMGRWTIFWINKLFRVSDFAPFMTEFVGVIFLCIAATLFNVLLNRITNYRVGMLASTIFACMFVSNPIISEVFVYYWHDGVGLGYVLTALALLQFQSGMEKKGKVRFYAFLRSLLFLWIAIGCYESFLILYILGLITILFLTGIESKEGLKFWDMVKYLGIGAVLSVGSVALRSVMIAVTPKLFGIQDVLSQVRQEERSLTEMVKLFGPEGKDLLMMLIKRFWLVYHVNAVVYLPVTVYELAVFLFAVASIILLIKKKNISFPILYVGMLITPFLLTMAEMQLSFYRSCQYLPFYAAAGMWMCIRALEKLQKHEKICRYALTFLAAVIIWNQADSMNRNFYIDYMKNENSKAVLLSIAEDIEREYGKNIPVVFTGHYSTPSGLTQGNHVPYTSWQYRYIATITDLVDPHLKEKYFSYEGYSYIGEANYDMIQWALDAFDGTNRELIRFLDMHGHSFRLVTNEEVLANAKLVGDTMPGWPENGSIKKMDGYVLVHLQD